LQLHFVANINHKWKIKCKSGQNSKRTLKFAP
jgi:hypothetical protein